MEVATLQQDFKHFSRGRQVIDQIVFHESVTRTRDKTIAVLKARKPKGTLGVHVIVDRDGSVSQHAPLSRYTIHGGSVHNKRSVSVEVVNPYYGSAADDDEPDIKAVWAHKGWYVLPSVKQLESVWAVTLRVLDLVPTIPVSFPGQNGRQFRWGPFVGNNAKKCPPGIMAHHRTAHADGLFPEHYVFLRHLGESPESAYELTLEAASSGKRLTPIKVSIEDDTALRTR